jgi:hypothetical protein
MGGSACDILRMFGDFCGVKAAPNIIFATTMWSRVAEDEESQRETQLKKEYWNWFLNNGSGTARFLNTVDSAWSIVDSMIEKGRIDTLLIQEDMIRLQGRVNETRAGATLCQTLQKAFTQEMDDFRKLQELAQEQNNVEVVRLLKVRCKEIEKDLRKTYDQVETRKIPLVRQILLFFKTNREVSLPSVIIRNSSMILTLLSVSVTNSAFIRKLAW